MADPITSRVVGAVVNGVANAERTEVGQGAAAVVRGIEAGVANGGARATTGVVARTVAQDVQDLAGGAPRPTAPAAAPPPAPTAPGGALPPPSAAAAAA